MSTVKAVLFLLCIGVAFVASQTQFTARVTISNRQGMSGAITGAFSYNAGLASMRINLDIGPVELYNYTARLKFLQCGATCETETWQQAMPILYPEADDTIGSGSVNGCQERRKARGGAPTIYVNGNSQVCRAIFADGSVHDFSAWGAAEGVASFQAPANCPKPLCTKRIDFELVFDESGSISANSFKQEKSFAQDFARSFTWGFDYVGMGLSMFASNGRLAIPLTFSQATFIQGAALLSQRGGSTCIGCGIQTSLDDITRNGRTIPGTNTPVSRVFLVLTDGENNVNDYTVPLNAAKNRGIIFFAIGIGSVDRNQIEVIGTDLPGIQSTFYGTDFSALPTILNGLITATCVNIPGNPCGAGCLGYCACGKTCMCPNVCGDGNACTTDVCTVGVAGNGCIHPATTCDDNNACTRDSCDPATGCVYTPISCADGNECTADSCDPRSGCVNAVITCTDASPCTADSCNTATGCVFPPIPNCPAVCTDPTNPIKCAPMNCYTNECDPLQNGKCVATPIVCDDRNPCTIDRCENSTGKCVFTPKNCDDNNKCTIDSCDATGTCQNIPFNATAVCNDYNACTVDTCEAAVGCVNKNMTCDDGNRCTNNQCSTVTGCYYPPVDCWQQDPDLANHPDLIGCFEAVCLSNSTKVSGLCMLTTINGSAIDSCGVCNGNNEACKNQIDSAVAAGLGGGAIAGIVIGAAGVAAVLGVLGGKKGYDIWLKHRANMQGANTNPLYTNNGLAGNNPMYEEGA